MAGFSNLRSIVDSTENGQSRYFTWRKNPSQVTTQGIWFDLSMSPGNPSGQYYAATPLASVVLAQSTDPNIQHGQGVSPSKLTLRRVTAMATSATPLPMPMILCDYLMFYPFIDESITDSQPMVNGAVLTRYTDGAGVRMMAINVAAGTGGFTFKVTYTNSSGVANRTTPNILMNGATAIGSIVSSATASNGAAGPFLPLQRGDSGVQSIQSVQMISGADVGLFTLVLVKPLLTMQIRGIDAAVEVDPIFMQGGTSPIIIDDAYLNFLCLPNGSLSGVGIHGDISYTWN